MAASGSVISTSRTFIIANASDQLRAAFGQFGAQGVTELIIDLRYNGGGLVDVADTMGDLLGSGRIGQVWSRTVLRASKADDNETRLFRNEVNAISAHPYRLHHQQCQRLGERAGGQFDDPLSRQ